MSPSATATTVLSRKVRKSSVHRVARASAWPPLGTTPPRGRSPETVSACLATRTLLAAHGRRGAAVLDLEQLAEADVPDLPHAVLVDRRAGLVAHRRLPVQRDVVMHRGLGGGVHHHRVDLGPRRSGYAGAGLGVDDRRELLPVLQQRDLLRGRGLAVEERLPVGGDQRRGVAGGGRAARGRGTGGGG